MSSVNRPENALNQSTFAHRSAAPAWVKLVFSGHIFDVLYGSDGFSTVFSTGVENFGERPKAH